METFVLLFALASTLVLALVLIITIIASEVSQRKADKEYEEKILNSDRTKRRLR